MPKATSNIRKSPFEVSPDQIEQHARTNNFEVTPEEADQHASTFTMGAKKKDGIGTADDSEADVPSPAPSPSDDSTSTSVGNVTGWPAYTGKEEADVKSGSYQGLNFGKNVSIDGQQVNLDAPGVVPMVEDPKLRQQTIDELHQRISTGDINDNDAAILSRVVKMPADTIKKAISTPNAYDRDKAIDYVTQDLNNNIRPAGSAYDEGAANAAKAKILKDSIALTGYIDQRNKEWDKQIGDLDSQIEKNTSIKPQVKSGLEGYEMSRTPKDALLDKQLQQQKAAMEKLKKQFNESANKMLDVQLNQDASKPIDHLAAEMIGENKKRVIAPVQYANEQERIKRGYTLSEDTRFQTAQIGMQSRIYAMGAQLDDAKAQAEKTKSKEDLEKFTSLYDNYKSLISQSVTLSDKYPEVRRNEVVQTAQDKFQEIVNGYARRHGISYGGLRAAAGLFLGGVRPNKGEWSQLAQQMGIPRDELRKMAMQEGRDSNGNFKTFDEAWKKLADLHPDWSEEQKLDFMDDQQFFAPAVRTTSLLGTAGSTLTSSLVHVEQFYNRINPNSTSVWDMLAVKEQKGPKKDRIDADVENEKLEQQAARQTREVTRNRGFYQEPTKMDLNRYDKDGNPNPTFSRTISNEDAGKFKWNIGSFIHTIGDTSAQSAMFAMGGQGIGGVLEGIGAKLGGSLAAGEIISNPALRKALPIMEKIGEKAGTMGAAYPISYEQYYQQGALITRDEYKRHQFAATNAAIDGATELIFPDVDLVKSMRGEKNLFSVFDRILKENGGVWTSNAFKKYTAVIAKGLSVAGIEGLEEYVGAWGQAFAQHWELGTPMDYKGTAEQAKQAFVTTAIGTLPDAVGASIGAASHLKKNAMYESGLSPDKYKDYVQNLWVKGKLSDEEANKRIQTINTMASIVEDLPKYNNHGEAFKDEERAEMAAQEYRIRRNNEKILKAKVDAIKKRLEADNKEAQKRQQQILDREVVPDEEHEAFKKNGTVSQDRLAGLATKAANNEPLSAREKEMLQAKADEVDKIITQKPEEEIKAPEAKPEETNPNDFLPDLPPAVREVLEQDDKPAATTEVPGAAPEATPAATTATTTPATTATTTPAKPAEAPKPVESKKPALSADRYDEMVDNREAIDYHTARWQQDDPSVPIGSPGDTGKIVREKGRHNMIDWSGRKIVQINIGGKHIPFYLSTGSGGKQNVQAGKWYPFFGIGADGWLNKTNEADINNYYGSEVLKGISQALDRKIGDIRSDTKVPQVAHTGAHIAAINKHLAPAENNQHDTIIKVRKNIADTVSHVENWGKQQAAAEAQSQEEEKKEKADELALIPLVTPTDVRTKEDHEKEAKTANERKRLDDILKEEGVEAEPVGHNELVGMSNGDGTLSVARLQQKYNIGLTKAQRIADKHSAGMEETEDQDKEEDANISTADEDLLPDRTKELIKPTKEEEYKKRVQRRLDHAAEETDPVKKALLLYEASQLAGRANLSNHAEIEAQLQEHLKAHNLRLDIPRVGIDKYNETNTAWDAQIAGTSIENLVVAEVMKPGVMRIDPKTHSAVFVSKAAVVVMNKEEWEASQKPKEKEKAKEEKPKEGTRFGPELTDEQQLAEHESDLKDVNRRIQEAETNRAHFSNWNTVETYKTTKTSAALATLKEGEVVEVVTKGTSRTNIGENRTNTDYMQKVDGALVPLEDVGKSRTASNALQRRREYTDDLPDVLSIARVEKSGIDKKIKGLQEQKQYLESEIERLNKKINNENNDSQQEQAKEELHTEGTEQGSSDTSPGSEKKTTILRKVIRKANRQIRAPEFLKALAIETSLPEEIVMQYFIGGGKIHPDAIKELWGGKKVSGEKSTAGQQGILLNFQDLTAPGILGLAHQFWEAYSPKDGSEGKYDSQAWRNAIELVLGTYPNQRKMAEELVKRHSVYMDEDESRIANWYKQQEEAYLHNNPDGTIEDAHNAIDIAMELSDEDLQHLIDLEEHVKEAVFGVSEPYVDIQADIIVEHQSTTDEAQRQDNKDENEQVPVAAPLDENEHIRESTSIHGTKYQLVDQTGNTISSHESWADARTALRTHNEGLGFFEQEARPLTKEEQIADIEKRRAHSLDKRQWGGAEDNWEVYYESPDDLYHSSDEDELNRLVPEAEAIRWINDKYDAELKKLNDEVQHNQPAEEKSPADAGSGEEVGGTKESPEREETPEQPQSEEPVTIGKAEALITNLLKYAVVTAPKAFHTGKDGVEYGHERIALKYKHAASWLVKMFEAAALAVTGNRNATQFTYKNYSFHYARPTLKGEKNGTITATREVRKEDVAPDAKEEKASPLQKAMDSVFNKFRGNEMNNVSVGTLTVEETAIFSNNISTLEAQAIAAGTFSYDKELGNHNIENIDGSKQKVNIYEAEGYKIVHSISDATRWTKIINTTTGETLEMAEPKRNQKQTDIIYYAGTAPATAPKQEEDAAPKIGDGKYFSKANETFILSEFRRKLAAGTPRYLALQWVRDNLVDAERHQDTFKEFAKLLYAATDAEYAATDLVQLASQPDPNVEGFYNGVIRKLFTDEHRTVYMIQRNKAGGNVFGYIATETYWKISPTGGEPIRRASTDYKTEEEFNAAVARLQQKYDKQDVDHDGNPKKKEEAPAPAPKPNTPVQKRVWDSIEEWKAFHDHYDGMSDVDQNKKAPNYEKIGDYEIKNNIGPDYDTDVLYKGEVIATIRIDGGYRDIKGGEKYVGARTRNQAVEQAINNHQEELAKQPANDAAQRQQDMSGIESSITFYRGRGWEEAVKVLSDKLKSLRAGEPYTAPQIAGLIKTAEDAEVAKRIERAANLLATAKPFVAGAAPNENQLKQALQHAVLARTLLEGIRQQQSELYKEVTAFIDKHEPLYEQSKDRVVGKAANGNSIYERPNGLRYVKAGVVTVAKEAEDFNPKSAMRDDVFKTVEELATEAQARKEAEKREKEEQKRLEAEQKKAEKERQKIEKEKQEQEAKEKAEKEKQPPPPPPAPPELSVKERNAQLRQQLVDAVAAAEPGEAKKRASLALKKFDLKADMIEAQGGLSSGGIAGSAKVIASALDVLATYADLQMYKFKEIMMDLYNDFGREFFDKEKTEALGNLYILHRREQKRASLNKEATEEERQAAAAAYKEYDNEEAVDDFLDNEFQQLLDGNSTISNADGERKDSLDGGTHTGGTETDVQGGDTKGLSQQPGNDGIRAGGQNGTGGTQSDGSTGVRDGQHDSPGSGTGTGNGTAQNESDNGDHDEPGRKFLEDLQQKYIDPDTLLDAVLAHYNSLPQGDRRSFISSMEKVIKEGKGNPVVMNVARETVQMYLDAIRNQQQQDKPGTEEEIHDDKSSDEQPDDPNAKNYRIPAGTTSLVPSTVTAKIDANLNAILISQQAERENRQLTVTEKEIVSRYSGWGGLKDALEGNFYDKITKAIFEGTPIRTPGRYSNYSYTPQKLEIEGKSAEQIIAEFKAAYQKVLDSHRDFISMAPRSVYEKGVTLPFARQQLVTRLVSEDEYDEAKQSASNAHYTSAPVVNAMWNLARWLGFKGGTVLEAGSGIGNFWGLMPQDLADNSPKKIAIERDPTTGKMLSQLYPENETYVKPFEKVNVRPGTVSLAIGNPPFGKSELFTDTKDKVLNKFSLHNYFIARNLRALKPGGVAILVTTAATMDNESSAEARRWFADKDGGNADLIGAIRLPNNAFEENAGTQVTTDILVFRKRTTDIPNTKNFFTTTNIRSELGMVKYKDEKGKEQEREETVEININEYFIKHPQHIIGKMMFAKESGKGKLYGNDYAQTAHAGPEIDVARRLQEIMNTFPAAITGESGELKGPETVATDEKNGKIFIGEDGKIYKSEGDVAEEVVVGQRTKLDDDGKPVMDEKGKVVMDEDHINFFRYGTHEPVARDYIKLRDKLYPLMKAEVDPAATDEQIAQLRTALNEAYDAFIAAGHESLIKHEGWLFNLDIDYPLVQTLENVKYRFVPDATTGKIKKFTDVSKGTILQKRINFPYSEPTKAESYRDAVYISIAYKGGVDLTYVTKLLGAKDEEEARQQLLEQNLVFENPTSGMLEVPEKYLSGQVRTKLDQAREAAEEDYRYQRNVDALEQIQPKAVPSGQIKFRMGVSYIPGELYTQFTKETLGVDASFTYSDEAGGWVINANGSMLDARNQSKWAVEGDHKINNKTDRARQTGFDLLKGYLTNNTTTVWKRWVDENGNAKQEKDIVATGNVSDMQTRMDQEFDRWMKRTEERRTILEKAYNDKFNNYVAPTYTNPPFKYFPGAAQGMALREHQLRAVLRALSGNTLMAHDVGTGKTAIQITTAMEMRRLGLAKKPMIVVKNATLESFAKDFKSLYPNAKILVMRSDQLSKKNRARFFARIANEDWDAIICPHSQFDMIADKPERIMQYQREKIDELRAVMAATQDQYVKEEIQKQIVKAHVALANAELELLGEQERKEAEATIRAAGEAAADAAEKELLEKHDPKYDAEITPNKIKTVRANAKKEGMRIARLKANLEKQQARKTDGMLNFDDLNIDGLLIDESHAYKRLGFQSSITQVKGIDKSASDKAVSAYIKIAAVTDKTGGRNIVFSTGTPVTNTMAELWTNMRYMVPKVLKEMGITTFDQFQKTFTEIEDSLEQNAGGTYESARRLTNFLNLNELMGVFRSFADVVTTDDIPEFKADPDNAPPQMAGGGIQVEQLPLTPVLRKMMTRIFDRYVQYKRTKGAAKKMIRHWPLLLFNIGKTAPIDPRLVDPNAQDDPNSKTNAAIKKALEIYHQYSEYKGTQLIFSDIINNIDSPEVRQLMGIQDTGAKFNLYEDIRQKLIKAGVPAGEIAVITDSKWSKISDRDRLFEMVRAGTVRFMIGGTEKMGVGVNVQDRLIGMHHIDAPARPDQFTQRIGRIVRQGNLFAKWGIAVQVWAYGTEGTRDASAFQRLQKKATFISQLLKGHFNRTMKDEAAEDEPGAEEFFGEWGAALSGNRDAMRLVTVKRELRREENKQDSYQQRMLDAHKAIRTLQAGMEKLDEKIAFGETNKAYLDQYFPADKDGKRSITSLKIGDKAITERLADTLQKTVIDPLVKETTAMAVGARDNKLKIKTQSIMLNGHTLAVITVVATAASKGSADVDVRFQVPELGIGTEHDKDAFRRELSMGYSRKVPSGSADGMLTIIRNSFQKIGADSARTAKANAERDLAQYEEDVKETFDPTELKRLQNEKDELETRILKSGASTRYEVGKLDDETWYIDDTVAGMEYTKGTNNVHYFTDEASARAEAARLNTAFEEDHAHVRYVPVFNEEDEYGKKTFTLTNREDGEEVWSDIYPSFKLAELAATLANDNIFGSIISQRTGEAPFYHPVLVKTVDRNKGTVMFVTLGMKKEVEFGTEFNGYPNRSGHIYEPMAQTVEEARRQGIYYGTDENADVTAAEAAAALRDNEIGRSPNSGGGDFENEDNDFPGDEDDDNDFRQPKRRRGDGFRKVKINFGSRMFAAGPVGVAVAVGATVWNGLVETAARIVEGGGSLYDALQKGYNDIRVNHADKVNKKVLREFIPAMIDALKTRGTLQYNLNARQKAAAQKIIDNVSGAKGGIIEEEIAKVRDTFEKARQALIKAGGSVQDVKDLLDSFKEIEKFIFHGITAQQMENIANRVDLEIDPQTRKQKMKEAMANRFQRGEQVRDAMEDHGIVINEANDFVAAQDTHKSKSEAKTRKALAEVGISDFQVGSNGKKVKASLFERMAKAQVDMGIFGKYLFAMHAKERNDNIAQVRREKLNAKIKILDADLKAAQAENQRAKNEYLVNPTAANKKEAQAALKDLTKAQQAFNHYHQYRENYSLPTGDKDFMRILEKDIPSEMRLMDDGASGMTNDEAASHIQLVQALPNYQAYEDFRKEVKKNIIDKSLRLMRDYDLISDAEYDRISRFYKNYVPLHVIDAYFDDKDGGYTSKFGDSKIHYAHGADYIGDQYRDNPMIQAIVRMQHIIHDGEHNRYMQTIEQAVKAAPDPEVWELQPVLHEVQRDSDGAVTGIKRRNPPPQSVLFYSQGGKPMYLVFKDTALYNAVAENKMLKAPRFFAVTASFFRHMATILNLAFTVTNPFRDIQHASWQISAEQEAAIRKEFRKSRLKIFKYIIGSFKASGDLADMKTHQSYFEQLAKDYEENGGDMSGYRPAMDAEIRDNVQKAYELYQKKGLLKNGVGVTFNMVELAVRLNKSLEQGTRLAVYDAAVNAGKSKHDAVQLARNATVNFNKRGNMGSVMDSLYLFYNASVQGTANVLRATLTTKQGLYTGARLMALGVLQSMWNSLTGDCSAGGRPDDCYDNVKPYDKSRYIMWKIPGVHGFCKIPSPQGFNVFYNMGEQIHQMITGKTSVAKATLTVLGGMLESFNPVSSASADFLGEVADPKKDGSKTAVSYFAQLFTPTLGDPLIQFGMNRDNFNKKIYNDFQFDRRPDSQKGNPWNTKSSTAFAKWLNSFGGDEKTSGYIDVQPQSLDFLASAIFGGAGKVFKQLFTTTAAGVQETGHLMAPETFEAPDLDQHDIPFLNRFYSAPTESFERQSVYDAVDESATHRLDPQQVEGFKQEVDRELKAGVMQQDKAEKYLRDVAYNQYELHHDAASKVLDDSKERLLSQDEIDTFLDGVQAAIDSKELPATALRKYKQEISRNQADYKPAKPATAADDFTPSDDFAPAKPKHTGKKKAAEDWGF